MVARIPAGRRRYPDPVREDLVIQAGSAPASGESGRWRQVALLGAAAALGGDARVRADLAAALHALDYPDAALHVAREAGEDPWARWWLALAAGQLQPALALTDVLEGLDVGTGPDAREVSRRLDDLNEELEDIASDTGRGRFGLLGVSIAAPRRALLVGRSSAVFVVAPAWDAVELMRLGPSDGPSGGNRAHVPLQEIIMRIRRGERGADRAVPPDAPEPFDAARYLDGLREDRGARDRRLLALADEVREERAQLAHDRANLRTEKSQVAAILRQVAALRAQGVAGATPVPTSRTDAAALLEVSPNAAPAEIERAFRAQIVRCHPDRVADLHPTIRGQAEGLTVALNAARDLLLGTGTRSRRR
jgi:hypothetical protein